MSRRELAIAGAVAAIAWALLAWTAVQQRGDIRELQDRVQILACVHTTNDNGVPIHDRLPESIVQCVTGIPASDEGR